MIHSDDLSAESRLTAVSLADAQATAATFNNRGLDLMKSGANQKALECFDSALAIDPNLAPVHFNRGNALSEMDRFAEALPSYEHAIALGLDIAGLHYRRGMALFKSDRLKEALESYDRALAMKPNMPMAVYSRGVLLQDMGRVDEAIASYEWTLKQWPYSPEAKFGLATACLFTGRWEEGWKYFEARRNGMHETRKGIRLHPVTSLPQWSGEADTAQDSLLVFAEQGMGDMMQFARYLPLAAKRFSKVSVVCPAPLARLFRASFSPAIEILDIDPQDQSAWRWQCPIMSLPRAFGTTLENVPCNTPYLSVLPEWKDKWLGRLEDLAGDRLKVGLVWAGIKNNAKLAQRSIAFGKFAPLLRERGIVWVSLQKGDEASQKTGISEAEGMIDWMDEVEDFADTAGLVSALDMVISIDTSVAHLAGALGKPVWMLNRFESEWRWMRDREDSPWYPTMHIYNQKVSGEWDEVLSRVQEALSIHLAK